MAVTVQANTGTDVAWTFTIGPNFPLRCSICGRATAAIHVIHSLDGGEILVFCDECYREVFSLVKLYVEMAKGDKAIKHQAEG